MKLSSKISSLILALAALSQSAIITYSQTDTQYNISDENANVGLINRKNYLNCSKSKPCAVDKQIILESYKEISNNSGQLQEVKLVLYNTSLAPASIETIGSDGKTKSVEFVDGIKAGYKDLGDLLKDTAGVIIEPFKCYKNLLQCISDSRYGITKNERTIKIKSGEFIRITKGSDAAFAYALALDNIDRLEMLISIPGISPKAKNISLPRNFSPTLKRKIIEGYFKEKLRDKYTWGMLFKEFGYETYKRSASNSQDLFNNALEITKNIPQDFLAKLTDGSVAATAVGDGVETLIQSVSTKGSTIVSSALFLSQGANMVARYMASEAAHNKPYVVFIATPKIAKPNNSHKEEKIERYKKSVSSPMAAIASSKQVGNIKYEICGDFSKWKRPTAEEQQTKLRSSSRYEGTPINNGYWTSNAIFFDVFGNSLLQDVTVWSGLWKPLGGKFKCPVFEDKIIQINEKKIAILFLINYKIQKIVWKDNQYMILVTQSNTGIQFINFPRVEKYNAMAISIMTESGLRVPSCSVQKC